MNFEEEMVLLKNELNEIYSNVDMRLYQHSTKAEVVEKIEDITHCILKDISIGNPPTLKTVKNDRFVLLIIKMLLISKTNVSNWFTGLAQKKTRRKLAASMQNLPESCCYYQKHIRF